MKLVVDVDGRVHRLHESHPFDLWPQGHVDARMRQATPTASNATITCLFCVYFWSKYLDAYLFTIEQVPKLVR